MTEPIKTPPDTPRGRPCVEIYRSIHGKYSWRVVAAAKDDSEQALRDALALALQLEDDIFAELAERHQQRRSNSA
jgi:hypothetical protein